MTMKKKKVKKIKVLDIVMGLILIIGVSVLAYPFIQNQLNDYLDQKIITSYQKKATKENDQRLEELKQEMEKKNQELAKKKSNPGLSSFNKAVEEQENQKRKEQVKKNDYYVKHTIAVLTIPKIKANLPVFDKTTELFLQKGASLLEGSSYPVGGKSTHSVISAHRGLPQARLFTDLPKMKKGDKFFVTVNKEKHAYKVIDIRVIKPDNTEPLKIQPDKDLMTLLTCTPYMVNSHRLLVTGTRIPYEANKDEQALTKVTKWKNISRYLWILAGALLIALLVYGIVRRRHAWLIGQQQVDFIAQTLNRKTKEPIPYISYALLTKNGKKPVYRDNQPIQLQGDAKGKISINHLKGGTYRLAQLESKKGKRSKKNKELVYCFIQLKTPKSTSFSISYPKKHQVSQSYLVPKRSRRKRRVRK